MAEPFLKDLLLIIQPLPISGEEKHLIVCKHFFSGAAGYREGKIFISLSPAGLALKLPQDDCHLLLSEGAKPLQYFPKAPVKKGYVILPRQIAQDEEKRGEWVIKSLSFVRASC